MEGVSRQFVVSSHCLAAAHIVQATYAAGIVQAAAKGQQCASQGCGYLGWIQKSVISVRPAAPLGISISGFQGSPGMVNHQL